ncbi:MAG: ADP-ribosylglycohydrolase family protein [Candidatus Hadarchaeum sp.]|uniref:ADP-ribosylglycohydrolase family protein n=1 Tax=Candidatus Hadarchaeum sp. TaxID=2883567 RepID=UPI00317A058C
MKAWEMELEMRIAAIPQRNYVPQWEAIQQYAGMADALLTTLWFSEVPGSGAPERLMVGAVQAAENRGLCVEKAENLLKTGLEAWEQRDLSTLHRVTALIWKELDRAPVNKQAEYWKFRHPRSWNEHRVCSQFPPRVPVDVFSEDFEGRIYAGWLAQICGGALGTAIEGYVTERLMEIYGPIDYYVRPPDTYNDDILYELAFLKAFDKFGYAVTSDEIAEEWVSHIPFGWSAEMVALENLRRGIFPPESSTRSNPFCEWIGAQMRGAVLGMVCPGNPLEAARLAWIDGMISHQSNGILGEVFNAVLTAMAFVERDVHELVQDAIRCIPKDSQYRWVVETALAICKHESKWLAAWGKCGKAFERYNWVHVYPNVAIEIIALWYGNGDFDKTMSIIAMAGQDVDCNAAQIGAVLGVMFGPDIIGKRWADPIHDELCTYMRGMEKIKISELARWTTEVVRKYRARS